MRLFAQPGLAKTLTKSTSTDDEEWRAQPKTLEKRLNDGFGVPLGAALDAARMIAELGDSAVEDGGGDLLLPTGQSAHMRIIPYEPESESTQQQQPEMRLLLSNKHEISELFPLGVFRCVLT